jgi:hypothetical protein
MRDLLGITTLPSGGTAGDQTLTESLLGDSGGPMTGPAWTVYQDVAEKIARVTMTGPNKSKFISCDPAAAGCLDTTITSFGRKAFRRPLTDAELARFQKLGQLTAAPTPDELAETILVAFLVSPSFLMLPELATDNQSSGNIRLSSYEVATRLSIMLWGSIPDDLLNAAADKNELQTKEQILAQAQRMLLDQEKAAPMIAAFHQQWVHADGPGGHWWKRTHDTSKFPLYTPNAVMAMRAELDAFFADVTFGHGTFADYFLRNIGFVNQDNAAIYGLDPKRYGSELKRVELDSKQRPGFLTRPGFLSSYSDYDRTAPFLRSKFIMVDLLGVSVPPDPDLADPILTDDFKTNREYSEALTSSLPCRGCHEVLNPTGFALENYDAIGAWQTVDPRGGAIDPTATVQLGNGRAPAQVSSPLQLMQEIAKDPLLPRSYAGSWISFAFRRSDVNDVNGANDNCLADQISLRISQPDYEVINVPSDLTQADSFSMRVRGTP